MSQEASGATAVGERNVIPRDEQIFQLEQAQGTEIYDQLQWAGRRLEVEDEERRGGVVPYGNAEKGIFLIVESNSPKNAAVAETVAADLGTYLSESEETDPTIKSRDAMLRVNEIIAAQPDSSTDRPADRGQVAVILMHISPDEETGVMQLHTASIGGGKVVKYADSDKSRKQPVELNENSEPSMYLDGSEETLVEVEYTTTDIDDSDRIALVSSAVVSNYSDNGITKSRHHKAAKELTSKGAAVTLLGQKRAHRDKDVIVVDVVAPESEEGLIQDNLTHETEQPEAQQRGKIAAWFSKTKGRVAERWAKMSGRDKKVGRHALRGAGVEAKQVSDIEGVKQTSYARTTHSNSRRNGLVGETSRRVSSSAALGLFGRRRNSNVSEDGTEVEKRRNKKIVIGVAAVIGGLAAYKYGSELFNYGIGDQAEIAGTGKAQGLDLIPLPFDKWGDGDWIDIDPTNKGPQWMNDEPVGGVLGGGAGDSAVGSGLENIPDEIPIPNPDDHFVEMKEFVGGVEPGSGLINEIHQYAHGPMGIPGEGFDAIKSEWVHEQMLELYGNDYIDLLTFEGPDTYVENGDVYISSPDARAQFASWAAQRDAERLIREAQNMVTA